MAIKRCARVGMSAQRKSAIPYSVTTYCKSFRKEVTALPGAKVGTILETSPFLVWATLVTAMNPRPFLAFLTPRTKSN